MTDLHAMLGALVAPLAPGDALTDGFLLVDLSTELGPRVRLRRGAQDVLLELMPLEEGLPHAVATARLGLSYRAGETDDPIDDALGLRLCRALAERVAANEARVLASGHQEAPRIREVTVTRALEPMGPAHERFFALSPYVGCTIGCRFCYAQSRLAGARRLLGLPVVAWGSWVDARTNLPTVLEAELAAGVERPIKFCPVVSDPYPAIESRLRLTRACLEVLARADAPPTLLLTRSPAAAEDLDRLAALRRAWFGVSLPTLDDAVRRHFEPRAADVATRLALLSDARARGISTFAVVQPVLPGDVDALADALSERVDSVRVDVLRGEESAATDFDDPRYADARSDAWQRERTLILREGLARRGVAVWTSELPPELGTGAST